MAHIVLRPHPDKAGAQQIVINGVDFSMEIYDASVELVEVGPDPEFAEVGLRVTFAVGRLDLGGDEDMPITNVYETAKMVRRAQGKADTAEGNLDAQNATLAQQVVELREANVTLRTIAGAIDASEKANKVARLKARARRA